ncbi:hypothetical protein PRIPAC_94078 [Pristionchus pacificus]|uniref:F-box domain-containing protein n=1 Tax=Pristionchus pacificus TaxID=54126 RepID=A0A2A6CE52_PRIPA|nr:hypothetical protein PRIPAC_94078 [Pristionchus pacificus]|eukprot:PDM76281.1 hypothetical protein PRIPAC_39885 [Pristionchus pacificus]
MSDCASLQALHLHTLPLPSSLFILFSLLFSYPSFTASLYSFYLPMAESSPAERKTVTIDALPEDLLVGIFDMLCLRDQTRLAACCTRLRSIKQHKVSAKFDAVVVFWCYKALKKARCMIHGPKDEGQFEIDESTQRLFERTRTNTLEITIKSVDDRPHRILSPLFNSLQYSSLEIDFTVSEEHNIPLLQNLMANRDLNEASFAIKWSRAMHEDIERIRDFLVEFPIVKSLDLTWIYWGANSESLSTEVITDVVLLYLVGRSREELIVGEGDCTVGGLMHVYDGMNNTRCRLVRVTVRREIAQEFHQTVDEPDRRVFVFLGKNTSHELIAMQQIVMTKQPEKFENWSYN